MVSFVPANTADAVPVPATVSRIPPSIAIVERRALNFSWFCAPSCAVQRQITAVRKTTPKALLLIVSPIPGGSTTDS
jgi:hypothetical protein